MTRKALALLPLLLSPWVVYAQAPAGNEFRVNTFTTGHQFFPAAAFDREGDFVIVWSAYRGAAAGMDVVGQRYAIGGVPVGAEFVVNTTVAGDQYTNQLGTPLAMRPDGRFVVAWTEIATTGLSSARFQRFESDGSPVGPQFEIAALGDSYEANVAVAPHGAFVVVWAGDQPDTDVFGLRFDAGGSPAGAIFRVNSATLGIQRAPRVAMDRQGNFVVVWQDRNGRDGSGHGVFGQRFDAAGQRLGAEFQVNTYTTGNQYAYSVAGTPDGRFVVAWDSPADGNGFGTFAQRYAASGAPIGGEFQVNSVTTGGQTYSSIATDDHYRLAASWQSTVGDGSGFGLRAQALDEQGAPRGAEFSVNTYTTLSQQAPNVAMDDVGNVLVTWHSDRQEVPSPSPNIPPGDDLGVFAQRYGGLHPRSLRADAVGNGVLEPGEVAAVQPTWMNVTSGSQTFSTDHANPEGPPGGVPQVLAPAAIYSAPLGAAVECLTCPTILVPNPAPRPALHWDGAITESVVTGGHVQRKRWILHVGASFTDVPLSSPFYRFVETLLHHSVTGGCTASAYCPAGLTTREQMAVFVLAAKEGLGYTPPPCATPSLFADVPASSPFCRWIEELARRGVVSGCGGGNYCPAAAVSREQMAVFVLRTAEPTRTPPACAPPNTFPDVPETSAFCPWVEELARRGIVTGCGGGNYCPLAPVTREQMGVFISGTFALALYGL